MAKAILTKPIISHPHPPVEMTNKAIVSMLKKLKMMPEAYIVDWYIRQCYDHASDAIKKYCNKNIFDFARRISVGKKTYEGQLDMVRSIIDANRIPALTQYKKYIGK